MTSIPAETHPAETHRFTLRGRIGGRPFRRPRRMPIKVLTAIGIYVVSATLGWCAVGVMLALTLR